MATPFRTTVAIALLLGGIVWSLPMQPGHSGATPEAPRYTATVPATFSISSTRAALVVSGHTISSSHEHQLQAAATRHFPDRKLESDFRPLGVAPSWWGGATTSLLEAVAVIDTPRASLTKGLLTIRGVVSNPDQAEAQLRAVRSAIPDGTQLDVRLTTVNSAVSSLNLCQRELRSLRFAPVYFDESGTRMRTSAVPVLEQVAAFADACRDTRIAITGHTDSSGNENYNQFLSLSRARTIAAWLQERGIEADRLEVTGAGSSFPVADNATRYGRSLNRRIDIAFSAKSPE